MAIKQKRGTNHAGDFIERAPFFELSGGTVFGEVPFIIAAID
jgi:hypothetical protein